MYTFINLYIYAVCYVVFIYNFIQIKWLLK